MRVYSTLVRLMEHIGRLNSIYLMLKIILKTSIHDIYTIMIPSRQKKFNPIIEHKEKT